MIHYPIVIQKDPDTDYTVAIPDLSGCVTAGETLDEALTMAQEAIELHVEGMLADGESLPEPKSIEEHSENPDYNKGTWALIAVDPGAVLDEARRRSTWRFTVIPAKGTEMTDELHEALYEAGCDAGTTFSSAGIVQIGFDRDAVSLERAIRSAIADVQKAGCSVAQVVIEQDGLNELAKQAPGALPVVK